MARKKQQALAAATARKAKAATADVGAAAKKTRGSNSASGGAQRFAAQLLPVLVVAFVAFVAVNRLYLRPRGALGSYVARTDVASRRRVDVPCYVQKVRANMRTTERWAIVTLVSRRGMEQASAKGFVEGCHKIGGACGRAVKDNFVTADEVAQLREIAEIGMANRSRLGGPTIMDVNTGFVKDGDGLVNIYQKDRNSPPIPRFTAEQFALYRRCCCCCERCAREL